MRIPIYPNVEAFIKLKSNIYTKSSNSKKKKRQQHAVILEVKLKKKKVQ